MTIWEVAIRVQGADSGALLGPTREESSRTQPRRDGERSLLVHVVRLRSCGNLYDSRHPSAKGAQEKGLCLKRTPRYKLTDPSSKPWHRVVDIAPMRRPGGERRRGNGIREMSGINTGTG